MHDAIHVVKEGFNLQVKRSGLVLATFPLFSEETSTELRTAELPNRVLAIASAVDNRVFFLNTRTLALSEDDAIAIDPVNDWQSEMGVTELRLEDNQLIAVANSETESIQITIDAITQEVIRKDVLKQEELSEDEYDFEDDDNGDESQGEPESQDDGSHDDDENLSKCKSENSSLQSEEPDPAPSGVSAAPEPTVPQLVSSSSIFGAKSNEELKNPFGKSLFGSAPTTANTTATSVFTTSIFGDKESSSKGQSPADPSTRVQNAFGTSVFDAAKTMDLPNPYDVKAKSATATAPTNPFDLPSKSTTSGTEAPKLTNPFGGLSLTQPANADTKTTSDAGARIANPFGSTGFSSNFTASKTDIKNPFGAPLFPKSDSEAEKPKATNPSLFNGGSLFNSGSSIFGSLSLGEGKKQEVDRPAIPSIFGGKPASLTVRSDEKLHAPPLQAIGAFSSGVRTTEPAQGKSTLFSPSANSSANSEDNLEDEDAESSEDDNGKAPGVAARTPEPTKPSVEKPLPEKAVWTTPVPVTEPDDMQQIITAMEERIQSLKMRLTERSNYKKMVAAIIQSLDKQWLKVDNEGGIPRGELEYTRNDLEGIECSLNKSKEQLMRALVAQDTLREVPKVTKSNLQTRKGSSIASSNIQEVMQAYVNLGKHAVESIELDKEHISMWHNAAELIERIDCYRSRRYDH